MNDRYPDHIKPSVLNTEQEILTELATDTIQGLSAKPKYLLSKYFYDETGSGIFQEIMKMPEYYLTDCETEILQANKESLKEYFNEGMEPYDLIEFGSGDGLKTRIIINSLLKNNSSFRFIPVDISKETNNEFCRSLIGEFPSLEVYPENGDYFKLIKRDSHFQEFRKVILFLGSNIGNLNDHELNLFLKDLSLFCRRGDKILIGFDLKKSPSVIMKAYDDPHGLTSKFNLNHLLRLNRELQADFNPLRFEHHSEYNPMTGKVKSFLVSTIEQTVLLGATGHIFRFGQWEPVYMELSQKFSLSEIDLLATSNGFRVEKHLTDNRKYFVDSLWTKI